MTTKASAWAMALVALGTTACGQWRPTPQPVQATNPTVTYNYRTDQELVKANQNAATYCSQYQASPRTGTITTNADGSKAVVFECVPSSVPAASPGAPSQSHTYRTDQELVQASQTASAYCQKYSAQPMTSTIVTNADGSKTVTFVCGPR